MRFTKMHGLGNCYIYVDCFQQDIKEPASVARIVSDRNTGVGSDGLILIRPSAEAACRMEMYNMDGSRGEMCGNGIRCVAKYVYDHQRSQDNPMVIETDAGMKSIDLTVEGGLVTSARVDMGVPGLQPEDLPTTLAAEEMIDRRIEVLGSSAEMTCVSMGNPHVVIYGVPFEKLRSNQGLADAGRELEHDPLFPERTNVHFVEIRSEAEVDVLTWERGSGATAACGTGACAVCVAGVLTGRSARRVMTNLPGGPLELHWRESDDHVLMTGPAVEIFSGDWPGLEDQVSEAD
jgi:diaminopimelate epimerase